ncbi:MAG: hypothetical protein OZ948_17820 [Deltaproteobacteria bacterium]|nr:hypothetical protein [Deltaproteobacteria bacterium]
MPTYRAPTMPPVWLGTGEGREYDVSGTSDSGDYVSGTVEKSGDGEVEGYLELEDGRTVYFEGEWDGPGEIEDYDEDGNHYDLEVDWRVALNAILRAAEATLAAPRWIL